MKFSTINPANEEIIAEYETMSDGEISSIVASCAESYTQWRSVPIAERVEHVRRLMGVLRDADNLEKFARLITIEMGKPITESRAEIVKCAWMAEVYADNAAAWLEEESVSADGKKHKVVFEPLGIILSIMPWNFPFWQALRFGVPALLAGNVVILKHSNTVPQCAFALEDIFRMAKFPDNVFRAILADHSSVEVLMTSDQVKGISFTGSTEAGAKIAGIAGRNIKKMVLELGGSDPFIVLDDADIDLAARNALLGRTINTGQSCIAAKRIIVFEKIADRFSERFAELMSALKVGDPLEESTQLGPLVNKPALDLVEAQVADSVEHGGKVLTGGKRLERPGYFFEPTVITNTDPGHRVISEEVFAPVAPVISVKDDDEAVVVANSTEFGLGGCVWTRDLSRGERIARELEAGSVFVNSITKSDPRMPFGGVKKSGIGRELSKFGLREFVNVKGLNIYEHE